jgi:hypothetical protein
MNKLVYTYVPNKKSFIKRLALEMVNKTVVYNTVIEAIWHLKYEDKG